jgi:hypothetical protein
MQNAKGGDASFQSNNSDFSYSSVVSDLVSLIEQVQAGIRLIESAIARESLSDDPEVATNVIVLDDVTPRYMRASAALNTCDADLGMALHFLQDSRMSHRENGQAHRMQSTSDSFGG